MNEPTWIPVTKNTLPPIGEWVLLWVSKGDNKPIVGKLAKGRRGSDFYSWETSDKDHRDWYLVLQYDTEKVITHWLPLNLPPPPITHPAAGNVSGV